jgi:hypothetical protein
MLSVNPVLPCSLPCSTLSSLHTSRGPAPLERPAPNECDTPRPVGGPLRSLLPVQEKGWELAATPAACTDTGIGASSSPSPDDQDSRRRATRGRRGAAWPGAAWPWEPWCADRSGGGGWVLKWCLIPLQSTPPPPSHPRLKSSCAGTGRIALECLIQMPNSEHLRFPGHRATFGGARAAWRGPVGPNRPWPEGGVVGWPVRAAPGVVKNDYRTAP